MLELSGSGEFSFVDEISVLVPYVAILMQTFAEAVEKFGKLRGVDFLMYRERQPLAESSFLSHFSLFLGSARPANSGRNIFLQLFRAILEKISIQSRDILGVPKKLM